MAGRFLYQRLSSTRLLGAPASSAARDVTCRRRHVSEGGMIGALFHGAARPGTADLGIHGYGGACIRALGNLLHEAASAHPCTAVTIIRGIHTNMPAPRCYSGLLTARTSKSTTGLPSVTTAFADSLRKQTLSSSWFARDADHILEFNWDAKRDAYLAELEANKATLGEADYEAQKAAIIEKFATANAELEALKNDLEADSKARKAKWDKEDAQFMFLYMTLLVSFGLVMTVLLNEIISEYKRQNGKGESSEVAAGSKNSAGSESIWLEFAVFYFCSILFLIYML